MVRDQLAEYDARVVAAMAELPRQWFVPPEAAAQAYHDGAMPIGSGQTISQPRVVAMMLAALRLSPGMRVLDVGAGSGYAAALIARLVAPGTVIAVERQGPLVVRTQALLAEVAPTVRLELGDGLLGHPALAPYQAIHVACACESLPLPLVEQLAPGGRLVIPIGPHGEAQELWAIEKRADGTTASVDLGGVLFVPGLPGVVD
jgi:protein-L-isoaspartate(D-aspartate) O-methyltransferase